MVGWLVAAGELLAEKEVEIACCCSFHRFPDSLSLSLFPRTALFTSGWSFRATLRYAALTSAFEAERGTPRTTWAGRGEEEDAAATTTMAEVLVAVGLLVFLLFLCWNDAASAAELLCRRGEGTSAATRGRTQRIVASAQAGETRREKTRREKNGRKSKVLEKRQKKVFQLGPSLFFS